LVVNFDPMAKKVKTTFYVDGDVMRAIRVSGPV